MTSGYGDMGTRERVTTRTIVFATPFPVEGRADDQPAGSYEVTLTEEPLEGLSFLAYRLVAATIMVPVPGGGRHSRQMLKIEPSLVNAALSESGAPAADAVPAGL